MSQALCYTLTYVYSLHPPNNLNKEDVYFLFYKNSYFTDLVTEACSNLPRVPPTASQYWSWYEKTDSNIRGTCFEMLMLLGTKYNGDFEGMRTGL